MYHWLAWTELLNINPGWKVNQGNNFSSVKMLLLSTDYVLFSLGLFMLKTEGQKI